MPSTNSNCTASLGDTCKVFQAAIEFEIAADAPKKPAPIISTETKKLLEFYLNVMTFTVTSLVGVVANSINMAAYRRQGLKDSITLGFFVLSLSDLFVVTMPLMTASCYAAKLLLPASNIDFASLHYVSAVWLRNMFYSLSTCFTAMLSLERCCCVVLPFKVKLIFSYRRTAGIVLVIFLFHVVCFLPIFATHRLQWHPMASTNGTVTFRFRVQFLPHRKIIDGFNSTLMGFIMPSVSQVIVTVCVVILINGLRKSSRFRKALTAKTNNQNQPNAPEAEKRLKSGVGGGGVGEIVERKDDGTKDASVVADHDRGGLSKRDARLVKTMIFLVIILSACNVPFLTVNYVRWLVPNMNVRGAYHNLSSLLHSIMYILGTINATANIFVYYSTSTRFRDTVREMFGCKTKE